MNDLPLYRVVEYNRYFENAKSRSVMQCQFVCVPNKHGGTGLAAVQGEADGPAIYGIWMWILQLCSRQRPPREGWLTSNGKADGHRLSAAQLSNLFRCHINDIHRCLQVLQRPDVGFIELVEGEPEPGTCVLIKKNAPIPQSQHPIPKYPDPDTVVSDSDTKVFRTESLNEGRNERTNEGKGALGENDKKADSTVKDSDTLVSDGDTTVSESDTARSAPDLIQHAEAKRLITALALAVFDRGLTEADWSNPEKDRWLDDALPIRRSDWHVLDWFYRLPLDHDVFKTTARRQSAEAFLENLKGEIDKAKTKRKALGLNGDFATDEIDSIEPDGWTPARKKTARDLFGNQKLPNRFADLGASVCRQIDQKIGAQKTEAVK